MREGWEYKTFGDVGSFLRGKNIQKADFVEKGYPCIHYGQIHTKFGISVDRHLSEIPFEVYKQSVIASHGDVIIAITSEDLDGSCKSTAWLGNYDVAVSSHAAIYKHHLNPKFIAYYLRSKSFYYEKMKYARGFKVMEIKPSDIEKIPIPVPPISEQERIASELDLISSIIEKKKAQLKELDNLAQSIFYDMFGDPVTNEKGWKVKTMKDVCIGIGDGLHGTPQYDPNGKIAFINGNNLINGKIAITDRTLFVNEDEAQKIYIELDANTILLSINGTLGKTAIYNNENVVLGKSACYLRLMTLLNVHFVMALMNTNEFKDFLENSSSKSTIKNVGLKAIRNFRIILPPLSLQQQFAEKIEAIEHQKELIQQSIKETETLFNSRMDYYFN